MDPRGSLSWTDEHQKPPSKEIRVLALLLLLRLLEVVREVVPEVLSGKLRFQHLL